MMDAWFDWQDAYDWYYSNGPEYSKEEYIEWARGKPEEVFDDGFEVRG